MKNFKLTAGYRSWLIKKIESMDLSTPKRVNIDDWKEKRSLDANAQYYVWLPTISEFECIDIKTKRNELKLDFGLPIILADEQIGQRFGESLQRCGFFNWQREEQVGHMEFLQVTSLMNTKQHNQMRDNVKHFYNVAGLPIDYL